MSVINTPLITSFLNEEGDLYLMFHTCEHETSVIIHDPADGEVVFEFALSKDDVEAVIRTLSWHTSMTDPKEW